MEELSQAKSTLEEENNEKDMIIEGIFDVDVMNMNNVNLFFPLLLCSQIWNSSWRKRMLRLNVLKVYLRSNLVIKDNHETMSSFSNSIK